MAIINMIKDTKCRASCQIQAIHANKDGFDIVPDYNIAIYQITSKSIYALLMIYDEEKV